MLGPLCDQTDKINFFVKPTILKEICIFKKHPQGQPQKSHEHEILQKHLQITQSIVFCTLRDAWVSLGIIMRQRWGMQR